MDRLPDLLKATVSHNAQQVKAATSQLEQLKASPGFPLALLEIISSDIHGLDLRLAASIYFKNLVKADWESLGTTENRQLIKQHIVALMLNLPKPLQSQLSAAVTLISEADFPMNWTNLLPELVSALSIESKCPGALHTLHAVLEKYRSISRSEQVLREMQVILAQLQVKHLEIFKLFCSTLVTDPSSTKNISLMEMTTLTCSIFQLMHSVDIPEYYEDHANEWFAGFIALLKIPAPPAKSDDDPTPLDKLKSQLCENLALFADKFQEQFEPFVATAVGAVWDLLCSASAASDLLVYSGIKFIAASACTKWEKSKNPFEDAAALTSICERVVLPNIQLRPSDEELFEDYPQEFVRRDVEGADQETRRRAAMDLVRGLSRFYEEQVTSILTSYAQQLITHGDWRAKEACAYLIAAIASRGQTRLAGVSKINTSVDVAGFFRMQLLPELQNPKMGEREILRACSLKFLTLFRGFIAVEETLPFIVEHLASSKHVVHTYAAHALSSVLPGLIAKGVKPVAELMARASSLTLKRLASDKQHNEYTMRLLLTLASHAGCLDAQALTEASKILPEILVRVVADPTNPMFSYYLFESLGCVLCSGASGVEASLLPVLSEILTKNITDFLPYAFQLLALLLERSQGQVKPLFVQLFPLLLTDDLWRQTGAVPALVRILDAYFIKIAQGVLNLSEVGGTDVIPRILGKAQFLLRSSKSDMLAFDLIASVFGRLPFSVYAHLFVPLLTMLLGEIRDKRTDRKVQGLCVCLSVYSVKAGGVAKLFEAFESIQRGLADQVLTGLWLPTVPSLTGRVHRKIASLALCALANELVSKPDSVGALLRAAQAVVTGDSTKSSEVHEEEIPEEFTGSFVKLKHAGGSDDYAPEVGDPAALLRTALTPHAGLASSMGLAPLVKWIQQ